MLPFSRTDLERLFPTITWERAERLFGDRAVVEVDVERDGRSIIGRVRGERRTPFLTRINVANGRGGRVRPQPPPLPRSRPGRGGPTPRTLDAPRSVPSR